MPSKGGALQEAGNRNGDKKVKKLALYTGIFGNPGKFNFPEISDPSVDRFCYTDLDVAEGCNQMLPVRNGQFIKNDFYQIKRLNLDYLIPIRRNRLVKILIPDEIFNNYEYSLYSDCKRPYTFDFEWMLKCLAPGFDFLIRKHRSKRHCAYDEGLFCIKIKKDTKENIMQQLSFYEEEGFPRNCGLYDASWLFRRHTKELRRHMKFWWEQVRDYSYRDQISLPYMIWKRGMKVSIYRGNG